MILEKQQLDCFSSPHLAPLLAQLNADRYVVYGVVTEICVRCAAFGLLKMGKPVELVTDAVKALDEQKAREMFSEFTAAGGRLTTSSAVLAIPVTVRSGPWNAACTSTSHGSDGFVLSPIVLRRLRPGSEQRSSESRHASKFSRVISSSLPCQ